MELGFSLHRRAMGLCPPQRTEILWLLNMWRNGEQLGWGRHCRDRSWDGQSPAAFSKKPCHIFSGKAPVCLLSLDTYCHPYHPPRSYPCCRLGWLQFSVASLSHWLYGGGQEDIAVSLLTPQQIQQGYWSLPPTNVLLNSRADQESAETGVRSTSPTRPRDLSPLRGDSCLGRSTRASLPPNATEGEGSSIAFGRWQTAWFSSVILMPLKWWHGSSADRITSSPKLLMITTVSIKLNPHFDQEPKLKKIVLLKCGCWGKAGVKGCLPRSKKHAGSQALYSVCRHEAFRLTTLLHLH